MIVLANRTYFRAFFLAQQIQDSIPPRLYSSVCLFVDSHVVTVCLFRPKSLPIVDSDPLVKSVRRVLSMAQFASPPPDFDQVFSSNVLLDNPNIWEVIRSLREFELSKVVSRATAARAVLSLQKGATSVSLSVMLTPERMPKIQSFELI